MEKAPHFLKITILILSALLVFLTGATTYARDTLNPGETLRRGDNLTSSNGRYRLIMQHDGNLVLYGGRRDPLWATNTQGQRVERCVMQSDGNLVLRDKNGKVVWAANTYGHPNATLLMGDDGNVVILDEKGVIFWSNGKPV